MDRPAASAATAEVPAARASAARLADDERCVLSCLERLLARRRRLAELGLCGAESPCAWHRKALDRAIVSYLLSAQEMGLATRAGGLLVVRAGRAGGSAA